MTTEITNPREQRGLLIAATSKLTRKGKVWLVPSQSGRGQYTVLPDAEHFHCSCPDHETTGDRCKHIYAAQFVMQREQNADGSVTETRQVLLTEKRTTYPQNWSAYNRAQVNEKAAFRELLRELCERLPDPPQANGRPRVPLADAIFAAVYKVYSGFSGRRFMTDLREAHEEGCISKPMCYNSVFKVFESPETFDILRNLVTDSALPLKALETEFACDSTGFSGCKFDRWFDHKWGPDGKVREMRTWVKAHCMVGVKTNVVTAVEIHDKFASDTVQLEPLMRTTRVAEFNVTAVAADMAYSSRNNLARCEGMGVLPLIPFKSNASGAGGGMWAKMFHYVQLNRDAFLARYHVRSNVESTFSAVKRKFGDSLRSKTDIAMKNEALAKLICHNICCVIHEMCEAGVDPTLWAEVPVAHKVAAN